MPGGRENSGVQVRYSFCIVFALLLAGFAPCRAQQTVFNVPSADVLDRGKVYGEFDLLARPSDASFVLTPRVVIGAGHRIEAGVNFLGTAVPATGEYIISPAIKWKFYNGGSNGWSVFVGDNLFIPVHKRRYDSGTYAYIEVAKHFSAGTRLGAGGCYFSPHVVADAARACGQFSVEQKLTSRLAVAADWFTGKHASGYITPGIIWSVTRGLTLYAAYEVGNSGALEGNHGQLLEIGYTF
jgi:hypothetical protein